VPLGMHVTPRRDLFTSPKTASAATATIEQASLEKPATQRFVPNPEAVAQTPASNGITPPEKAASTGSASSSNVSHSNELSSSTLPARSFVPTPQWKNSWKRALPLEPIYRMLDFFAPKVDAVIAAGSA
jgi:hypothetical protein